MIFFNKNSVNNFKCNWSSNWWCSSYWILRYW